MTIAAARKVRDDSTPRHPLIRWLSATRARLEYYPRTRFVYRAVVALFGVAIVLIGIVLIPLPGPGWLIVFLGFAVLGTEFAAARRFNEFLKRIVHRTAARWRLYRARRRAANRTNVAN